jgi:hypothetical protein
MADSKADESVRLSIEDHGLLPFPPGIARLIQGRMWPTRRMNKRRQRVGVRRLEYPFTVISEILRLSFYRE